MKINWRLLKKEILRLVIFLLIPVTLFIFPLYLNNYGPWLDYPGENGPYLSWGADASTSVVISYTTPENVSTTLFWGLDTTNLNTESTSNLKIHTVNLTTLTPNTLYYYKVNSTEINCRYMNQFYQFKTGFNQTHPGAFRFAVYGDNQLDMFGRTEHPNIVDAVLTHQPEFVINTGDIVDDSKLVNFDRFFYEVQDLASRKPYMVTIGNHEFYEGDRYDEGERFREFFSFPGGDMYYSFNYSNVCFIALNMSIDEHRINPQERTWLLETLDNANNSPYIDWIIVYYHVPLYSSGGHGCNQDLIDDYGQIFDDYKIDLIFQGHDHHYERMHINHTYYFVNGGGGGMLDLWLPWFEGRTWSEYRLLCYHYLIVDIDGKDLHLQAIRADGFVFDELHLVSPRT